MDIELFDYSPIVEREAIEWPDGARAAFYVGLNIEHCGRKAEVRR
jgi:hypothetical protein